MIDLTIPDAGLADAYFAKLNFGPDEEDDETLEVIAEVESRGSSITDPDQIVQKAADEEAATLGRAVEHAGRTLDDRRRLDDQVASAFGRDRTGALGQNDGRCARRCQ